MGNHINGEDVNVRFLLHGTKAAFLRSLLASGLDEKFSDGLLGKGTYLAEDASKIDQYCTSDPGEEGHATMEGLNKLHHDLYARNGLQHPGSVHYAIVCAITIGMPIYTKDGESHLQDPGMSVFATEEKRQLASV